MHSLTAVVAAIAAVFARRAACAAGTKGQPLVTFLSMGSGVMTQGHSIHSSVMSFMADYFRSGKASVVGFGSCPDFRIMVRTAFRISANTCGVEPLRTQHPDQHHFRQGQLARAKALATIADELVTLSLLTPRPAARSVPCVSP